MARRYRFARQLLIVRAVVQNRSLMKRILAAIVVLLPSVVLAQPYGQPPPPPPSGGYQQPPPPPGNGAQPVYTQPANAASFRKGITGELNLGVGFIWARNEGQDSDTEVALAGLSFGIGGWLNERMALTARGAGATYSPADGVRFTTAFFGPSLQYWTDDHFWIGGGAGLGIAVVSIENANVQPDPETGFGLDLRAGYTFTTGSANTFNVSLEYNPTFFDVEGQGSIQINSFGILLGYQHL